MAHGLIEKGEQTLETKGFHVIIDAFNCKSSILDDAKELEKQLDLTAERLEMIVLDRSFHKFEPYGVTGTLILSTSHMSIHTWPEKNYAAIDIYTCGKKNPFQEVQNILQYLGAEYAVVYNVSRGAEYMAEQSVRIIRNENN
ncbi:adenosylmethionine decarboxylase [Peribacillus simplex]|uniref:S-adenosylmethionine decarboxylase proenzyme n=1 Tax=Peribacillus simplex TaxID=1478 RepID=A0A9X8ZCK9_9BACI|nr:adenosylmethionine decarboxylase [Peribacillus simplex]TKH06668.1 adenosylmethionine decarboxylase [Peribacillus simplex]